ncbi:MAG: thioredoxin [Actinobacteria bacterium]|nr:thioredoxin [Actinomycetota bacterium]
MASVVDGLTGEYEGIVAIRKYDVQDSEAGASLADEHGVEFVPTFVFVNSDGERVDVIIGEVPEQKLRDTLDKLK